jgi:hypothetical protein
MTDYIMFFWDVIPRSSEKAQQLQGTHIAYILGVKE